MNAVFAEATRKYLEGICRKTIDGEYHEHYIFFQKSWLMCVRLEDGGNPDHLHKGSHFSGIYYLRTEGEGGNSCFAGDTYMDRMPLNVRSLLSVGT